MEYPFFDVPLLGGGLLIGIVAIVHVFVSHFAVGGGLYLVLTEKKAYRENNNKILDYVRGHARFFVLLTLVFGAITGVGIWFTIALVHPQATSSLIHGFVWGWAIEWVFFFVEIAAAFVYYYAWNRLSRKTHVIVGWIYFIAAWASLAIINGILTFMLTPGAWIQDQFFWSGFFNPTYFPSLIIRTAVALILAGLYGLLTSSFIKDDDETKGILVKYNAKWVMAGVFVMPFAGLWYVSQIPPLSRFISMGGAAAVTLFAAATVALSALILLFTWISPLKKPKEFTTSYAIILMVLGFAVTGITEWTREAVRKPYVIYNYMYSNGIMPGDKDRLNEEGVLANARWSSVHEVTPGNELVAGEEMFKAQCGHCHVVDGYNAIKPLAYGWDKEFARSVIDNLQIHKPFMPAVFGTDAEKDALAAYLASLNANEPPVLEAKR